MLSKPKLKNNLSPINPPLLKDKYLDSRAITIPATPGFNIKFNPLYKEEIVIGGRYKYTIDTYNLITKQLSHSYINHTNPIESLVFSPDGSLLASGGWDGIVTIWDNKERLKSGNKIKELIASADGISSLSFSPDGDSLLIGNYLSYKDDVYISLWSVSKGESLYWFSGHSSSVRTVDFHPNGVLLASGGEDGYIFLWNKEEKVPIYSFKAEEANVLCLSFTPDGKYLIYGGDEGIVKVWDIDEHKEVRRYTPLELQLTLGDTQYKSSIYSLSIHASVVAVGLAGYSNMEQESIYLWDYIQDRVITKLTGPKLEVTGIAFEGNRIACCGEDNQLYIWS